MFISKCELDKLLIGIIGSNYINFYEIIGSYAAKNYGKLKQLVETAVFNESFVCFMKNKCRRVFISKCELDNILIDIIRNNYVNFCEIMYSNEAKKLKKNSDN
jgi:hypothetical protein